MCTVVCRWTRGEPVRLLALRDEFVSRPFDLPGEWWPDQPGVIGGRDQLAGGTWCASDVATGVTALVLNRIERRDGTPSRGLLPLAAVASGEIWPAHVDHRGMAGFNLVLAGPAGVTVWTWGATTLQRIELEPGLHMITPRGVDPGDPKSTRFTPQFDAEPWLDVVTADEPSDAEAALVVRHPFEGDVYATVFGQLITSAPGSLHLRHSRTPWRRAGWVEQTWP